MKHTLLASTALVALTGAAAAEITISGTARIGFVTTEGAAAVGSAGAGTTYGKMTAANAAALTLFGGSTSLYIGELTAREYGAAQTALAPASTIVGTAAVATDITEIDSMIAVAENLLAGTYAVPLTTGNIAVPQHLQNKQPTKQLLKLQPRCLTPLLNAH